LHNFTIETICNKYVALDHPEAFVTVCDDITSMGKMLFVSDGTRYVVNRITYYEMSYLGRNELLDVIKERLDTCLRELYPPSTKDLLSDIMSEHFAKELS
jgi:hypothetical protein